LTPGRVVVVGLGPAGADLLLPAARGAIERIPSRFVRTVRHPAVDDLGREGVTFRSFDHVYDEATTIDDVYPAIVEALTEAARRDGEVLYAVPGNPAVAEHSVTLLRGRDDVTVEIVPGLSFAELAWARVGIDPMATGARVADAHHLTLPHGAGPVLLAQVDSTLVLSDVKLALLDRLGADARVVVLQHLGLPDESVRQVSLGELDRVVEPDHLTAVVAWLDRGSLGEAMERFVALTEQLRGPGGCPWDAEQTHRSLARYALEEAYEVVEAIEDLPAGAPAGDVPTDRYHALEEELGDLLYQVVFHATLAREAGAFTMDEVIAGIHDKLVRRHPHVFGDVDAQNADEVLRNWEQIKRDEKGRESVLAGVDPALPALLYAHKLLGKAASVGIEAPTRRDAVARVVAAAKSLGPDVPEVRHVPDDGAADPAPALAELLAAVVALARSIGLDGESVLRGWAARFRERFEMMERDAAARGIDLAAGARPDAAALWDAAAPR
jgi:tetrapyrrole methylase family protein/MazG family protein